MSSRASGAGEVIDAVVARGAATARGVLGLGLLPALLWACSAPAPPGPPPAPSVLVIVVDTLRADRLGSYGYPLETSPAIDALAKRGVRLADVTVQWPTTWPSMVSFMSGAYPRTTGVRLERHPAPPALTMLGEIFDGAGYHTGAIIANYNVGRRSGLTQGIDRFVEVWAEKWARDQGGRSYKGLTGEMAKRYTDATLVNEQALRWLRSLPAGEKFFLWVHYMDTHGPYLPPPEVGARFRGAHPSEVVEASRIEAYQIQRDPATGEPIADLGFYKAQYDGEVRHADDQIGRLLEEIGRAGLDENLLVLFMSDHGESLGEHGYFLGHGKLPYQSTARAPVILVWEGGLPEGRVVEEPVGLIDVSRTLVELAGLTVPAGYEGKSLTGLIRGTGGDAPEYVFMESGMDGARPQRTVRHGSWKLVEILSDSDRAVMKGERYELYDLSSDREELRNVAAEHPERVAQLSRVLNLWLAGIPPAGPPGRPIDVDSLSEKERDMLRSLGYIE